MDAHIGLYTFHLVITHVQVIMHITYFLLGRVDEIFLYSVLLYLQDSLVVCRLRKNSDFHLNNTPNQASRTRRNPHSICTASGGTEVTETSEGDKGVESCSKKCSSSHDSFSIEQTNSINEAELKLVGDVNLTASSSHQKVGFFFHFFLFTFYYSCKLILAPSLKCRILILMKIYLLRY